MATHLSPTEHAQPLLEEGRNSVERNSLDDNNSLDIELTELNGERTPDIHYTHPKPPPKDIKFILTIAGTLFVTVLGFTINTEATAYFEDILGWKKPFATMYITHSSLALPWLCHLAYLRFKNRNTDYRTWVKQYNNELRSSISTIDAYVTSGPSMVLKRPGQQGGPLDFLATTMAIVTVVLTVSGSSWFFALALTTPSDLTAIYNCATFFAAAFSVPILHEKLGLFSMIAVVMSIAGTFVIAYGDTTAEHPSEEGSSESKVGTSRLLGNLIACIGAVAFGLYEVLFKKWACSSRPQHEQSSLPLTLAASALTGMYTFCLLWPVLILLHIFSIEEFVWPSGKVALWIAVAVLSGSMSITLLVLLVIWTDPIFGSMANVLSVFTVAIADWFLLGLEPSLATYIGGATIFVAFGLLAWDTFRGNTHT